MDDQHSASELRRRYHAGGSVKDSDLPASQLRARYGIAGNSASPAFCTLPRRRPYRVVSPHCCDTFRKYCA